MACRDQGEKLPWADEVFISKADFDDKKQRMSDLEGQVCIWLYCTFTVWYSAAQEQPLAGLLPLRICYAQSMSDCCRCMTSRCRMNTT